MTAPPDLLWQSTLDDALPPVRGDLDMSGVVRHRLDGSSWIDVAPGWLHDHAALMADLARVPGWEQRRRTMFERVVDEPRMVLTSASFEGAPPEVRARVLAAMSVLCNSYDVAFDSVLINLYRDGRDAVAWHGDTVRKVMAEPLVATISLGHARRFRVRRRGGPVVLELHPGGGDLVVMGGRCQQDFEHTVPRERVVGGARMSITIRHSTPT